MGQVSTTTLNSTGSRAGRFGLNERLALAIQHRLRAAARPGLHPARAKRHQERAKELKARLWKRLQPQVRRLACGFAGRWGELDDLVQEAFLRFDAVITSYDPSAGASVWVWLHRVFRNQFISQLRKRHDEPGGDALDSVLQPGVTDQELANDLWQTVDTLLPEDPDRDPKLRAFRLYWTEGWTLEELRQKFGQSSLSKVYKWLTGVADALRERLPQSCPCLFQPGEHLAHARRLIERRKFGQARTLLRQVAELLPDADAEQREEARRLVAETLAEEAAEMLRAGRMEKALALLEELLGDRVPAEVEGAVLSLAKEVAVQFRASNCRSGRTERAQEIVRVATSRASRQRRATQVR